MAYGMKRGTDPVFPKSAECLGVCGEHACLPWTCVPLLKALKGWYGPGSHQLASRSFLMDLQPIKWHFLYLESAIPKLLGDSHFFSLLDDLFPKKQVLMYLSVFAPMFLIGCLPSPVCPLPPSPGLSGSFLTSESIPAQLVSLLSAAEGLRAPGSLSPLGAEATPETDAPIF